MTDSRLRLEGGCHCGTIRLRLDWPDDVGPTAFRHCTCTFCTKHNARYCAHPDARLAIGISAEADINRYRFGTKTADFLICRTCGVMPVATCDDGASLLAVVNVNTLDDYNVAEDAVRNISFDGEEIGSRLDRRRKTWIGNVQLEQTNS